MFNIYLLPWGQKAAVSVECLGGRSTSSVKVGRHPKLYGYFGTQLATIKHNLFVALKGYL